MAQKPVNTLPPHNVHAERAVLGSLLIDPDSFPKAAARIRAEDFYIAKHTLIFAAYAEEAQDG